MTSGIYKLVNKRTSETYVGQSKNVQKRAERHIQELKESIHHNAGMQEDFNNGDEFVLELVEETNPHKQILNEHEMLWISRLNTFYEGYNKTPGGDYDKSKGNIGYGGGRLPESKYKPYQQSLNINFQKDNETTYTNVSYDLLQQKTQHLNASTLKSYYTKKDTNKLYLMSIKLYGQNKFEEALETMELVLKLETKYEYLNCIGKCLMALERYDEALDCFNEVNQITLENIVSYKPKALEKLGRVEEALKYYDKNIEIDPKSPYGWCDKAACLENMGRYEEALQHYNKAIELDEEDTSHALAYKGNLLHMNGHTEEALDCFNQSLKYRSTNIDERSFERKNITHHPFLTNYFGMLYCKASCLDLMRKFEESSKCWDEATSINPNNSVLWFNKGKSLQSLEKYEEALECYIKAVDLNYPYSLSLEMRDTLIVLHRYEEALNFHNLKEIPADEVSPRIENNIKKLIEQLIKITEKLKIDYNDENLSVKGSLLTDLSNEIHSTKLQDDAIKCLNEALELNPKNEIIWKQKGQAYFYKSFYSRNEKEDYKNYMYCYDKALEINPKDEEALINKAYGHWVFLNEDLEAIKLYNKVLEINPNNEEADRTRDEILLYTFELSMDEFDDIIDLSSDEMIEYLKNRE